MKRLTVKVYGIVQGVFFRHSTRSLAISLGLTGFIRNEPDETVYIEAEGEEGKLNELLVWSRHGPPSAWVSKVDFEFSDNLKNFKDFLIE